MLQIPRDLVEYLMTNRLLHWTVRCPICLAGMELAETKKFIDGFIWLFRQRACSKKNISICRDSHFPKMKVELKLFVRFLHLWCRWTSLDLLQVNCNISKKTAADYARFARIILVNSTVDLELIGGPWTTVESDESLLARRKYNHGRIVPQVWILGGI